MVNINCNINTKKIHFAKQIASRLDGKIENVSAQGELKVTFNNSKQANQFNRFVFVINQSFA